MNGTKSITTTLDLSVKIKISILGDVQIDDTTHSVLEELLRLKLAAIDGFALGARLIALDVQTVERGEGGDQ